MVTESPRLQTLGDHEDLIRNLSKLHKAELMLVIMPRPKAKA
jgi:hypothetical protein